MASKPSNAGNTSKSCAYVNKLSSFFYLFKDELLLPTLGSGHVGPQHYLLLSWLIVSSSKLILELVGPLSNESAEVVA